MNCAYHIHHAANASCNGCGKPLCPACDHRIKGFPYCQDCIVSGIELLREHSRSNYVPFVKKQTSPVVAVLLSAVCPGLGAAYNGQTTKAVVYFAVFVGLFQMAVLSSAAPMFVLGFIGMWFFAVLDAWRTARAIRAGVTPDAAEDILVSRFAGNPKLWGVILLVLGAAFLLQRVNLGKVMYAILPVVLIGLGIYILRGYIFRKKESVPVQASTDFVLSQPSFRNSQYDLDAEYPKRASGGWRDR